jgi:hypothetical protein
MFGCARRSPRSYFVRGPLALRVDVDGKGQPALVELGGGRGRDHRLAAELLTLVAEDKVPALHA